MILFKRDGSSVVVTVNGSGSISRWCWNPTIGCASEAVAQLLRDNFSSGLFDRLKAIREEAYRQGYEDKKKRRPAKTWFKGAL